jgi:hypothetical protein
MAKNLFLDDTRQPSWVYTENPQDWHLVRGYEEFVEYLNGIADSLKTEDMPPLVSFDYMLGTEKNGEDCARFLAEFCLKHGLELPDCNVHSSYPYAVKHIRMGLNIYFEKTGEEPAYVELIHHNN